MKITPAQMKQIIKEIKGDSLYKLVGETNTVLNDHLMKHLLAQDDGVSLNITSGDLFQMRQDIRDALIPKVDARFLPNP